ncbi:MAG: phenylalanine--tRNA ligase subunit beta [Piccolia ochrophora]|nr:MAG: phenylalanine--tRNA ligase subunit beta [Piccolia ochrophora]
MPTIAVDKAALFKALGREYTTEEFDELCFEFGIELDEDVKQTSNSERPITDGKQEPPQLKIEIPANRYDMLCFEGISLMLRIFRQQTKCPNYRLKAPANGEFQTMTIHPDTAKVRPYVSCAVLRNIKFTQERYDSFIALQDKLHQNLARQRTLASIGTHDLDTLRGPFTYEALPPEQIRFRPLNQSREMNGHELMEFYEKDKHLSRYLHIIRDSPLYPVIYDAKRTVCSLPPIINGDHSKITLDTKNILIEITALDRTKVEIVNCILVAMFSQYTEEPFTVEPVKIISPHNHASRETPDLTPRETQAEVSYINECCGLDLSASDICSLLKRMAYQATPSKTTPDHVDVAIPPTRADVLHQCDIMEDVAVAYGFNNLPRSFPGQSGTIARPLPINKLTDIARIEAAMAGWTEVMPLILCSHAENFAFLNRVDDGTTAVKLANPKTAEYQVVRTSLLPGLLKTIRENKHHAVPMKIFEVSDVAFKDVTLERKSRNERHFAAAWYGKTSGFEVVHGLLDRVMLMLKSSFLVHEGGLEGTHVDGYWIEELDGELAVPLGTYSSLTGADKISSSSDPTFFPGHAAAVHVRINGKKHVIGTFGILHPTVLEHFELRYARFSQHLRQRES